MSIVDEVVSKIFRECAEDYVGLWVIIWELRNEYKIEDQIKIKRNTLKVVEELLSSSFTN